MAPAPYSQIKNSLRELYESDPRPWLVGFSGGKDSTMVASVIFDAILSLTAERPTKKAAVFCTDTRVEIPALVEMVEKALVIRRRTAPSAGVRSASRLTRSPPSNGSA